MVQNEFSAGPRYASAPNIACVGYKSDTYMNSYRFNEYLTGGVLTKSEESAHDRSETWRCVTNALWMEFMFVSNALFILCAAQFNADVAFLHLVCLIWKSQRIIGIWEINCSL